MILGLTSKKSSTAPPIDRKPFGDAKTPEEKIKIILAKTELEDPADERRRAKLYYRVDLYFRGYQNLGEWDDALWTYSSDEEDPMDSTENRFQRNVLINAGSRIKMEPTVAIRAASGSFNDLEAAKAAEDALEILYERIEKERLVADKAINTTLFGNTFNYTGWHVDRRAKSIMRPKFKYDDINIDAQAFCLCGASAPEGTPNCPKCGSEMMEIPQIGGQQRVQDGEEEIREGQEFTVACTPLEIKVKASAKHGFRHTPYLQWITAEDIDEILYAYPWLDLKPGRLIEASSDETRMRLLRRLSNLPGYIGRVVGRWGNGTASSDFRNSDVMVNRLWLRPQMFRNDAELLKEFPDGLRAVAVDGKVVKDSIQPADMDKEWTHEVYIRNPHSLYGDGMFSDIPIQDQINRHNVLVETYMENCTSPKRLIDAGVTYEEDLLGNDPRQMWVRVNVDSERSVREAVHELFPAQLPPAVGMRYQQLLQADKDISRASDPRAGQIAGANTPYAAQVLAVEQSQVADLPSQSYNKPAVRQHAKQLLELARENWITPQTLVKIDENTGRKTWKSVSRESLMRGEFTIRVKLDDFKPKTRAEHMYGMEYARNFGIDVTSTPKLRLEFLEKAGLDLSGDMISTQARRAHRMKDKIVEAFEAGRVQSNPDGSMSPMDELGQPIVPDDLVDDGTVQYPTILEFLASEQGDQLRDDTPDAWKAVKEYAWTCMEMTQMRNMAMAQVGGAPPQEAPAPTPGGGSPKGVPGGKQQFSQSPVDEGMKQPLPPNPAVQRP